MCEEACCGGGTTLSACHPAHAAVLPRPALHVAAAGEKGGLPRPGDWLSPADSKMLADVLGHVSMPWPDWLKPAALLSEELLPCLQPSTVLFVEHDALDKHFANVCACVWGGVGGGAPQ